MMKVFPPLELSWIQQCQRVLRHWFTLSRSTKLLPEASLEAIASHIEASEEQHTGEIAIAFETRLPYSYLSRKARARERAWSVFSKMQVWDTPDDNGVLIYFLVAERRIEIVADRGLAAVVPQSQWDAWVHTLYVALNNQELNHGLHTLIDEITAVMVTHFPQLADSSTDNRASNRPQML